MAFEVKLNVENGPFLIIDLVWDKLNVKCVVKYFILLVCLNWSDENRLKFMLFQTDKIFIFVSQECDVVNVLVKFFLAFI